MLPQLANRHGVYTQPGGKGVAGLLAWEAWSGTTVSQMLDFTGTASWKHITSWLPFAEWAKLPKMGKRLELSVAMLPDDPGTTLDACAAGAYNEHWNTLATNLVANGLAEAVIRPGWELNCPTSQYRWSARARQAEYAEAFRQIVTTIRNVPYQAFPISWNVMGVVEGRVDYSEAWPGSEFVDVVGVDPYDVDISTLHYPYRSLDKADLDRMATEVETTTAQDNVWRMYSTGTGGLQQWREFARIHGDKPMAIDEWGVTHQPTSWGSHGGGDNPRYIDRMANWIADPANRVAWSNYFEIDNTTSGVRHMLSRPDTLFPRSAERYLARVGDIARPCSPMATVHVLPVNDLVQHEESDECMCGPDTEPVKADDGAIGWVITHHALDGRP